MAIHTPIMRAPISARQFCPIDWLARFNAVGGWCATVGGKVHAGWQLSGGPQDAEAREVWREIESDEERRAPIRALLLTAGE